MWLPTVYNLSPVLLPQVLQQWYWLSRNIIYGLEEEDGMPASEVPSLEAAQEAARLANIHDTIVAMPQGYDTVRPDSSHIPRHACWLAQTLTPASDLAWSVTGKLAVGTCGQAWCVKKAAAGT